MSFEAAAWAWKQWDQEDITSPQKILLMALANYADENGNCFPKQESLAKKTSLGRQSVNKNLKVLEEKGLVKIISQQHEDGRKRNNLYILPLDRGMSSKATSDVVEGDSYKGILTRNITKDPFNETVNTPARSRAREKVFHPLQPPDFVKQETWDAFLTHRTKLKAPNSDYALRLLVTRLKALQENGDDPNEALDEALLRGWKSVFPPKYKSKSLNQKGRDGDKTTRKWSEHPDSPSAIKKRNKAFFKEHGLNY
jgi:DNA-binding MarR family transcriptional regulator